MSTYNDMVNFIKTAWPARKFIVPCLVGPVGIGKTMATKQAAEELGAGKVVTIIASQILPNEVSGITMPVPDSKAMEIFDHFRLSSLKDGDILFFDELLEADQLVLSACLTLIESRELMSGHKLPDVMIVAATNPTIKPNMLKENIRQRFLFREFKLDRDGCREYINELCGFDPGQDVVERLVESGNEYNILTPRSLTKMCQWIATADNAIKASEIGMMIDVSWNTRIGSELSKRYCKKFYNPMEQVRNAINQAINESNIIIGSELGPKLNGNDEFTESTLEEVMSVLQQLPEWNQIQDKLSMMEMTQYAEEQISF